MKYVLAIILISLSLFNNEWVLSLKRLSDKTLTNKKISAKQKFLNSFLKTNIEAVLKN